MNKNVGTIDATLRALLGCLLIYLGLFVMDGVLGNIWGIVVASSALLPFYMVVTRKCFVFKFLGFSSIRRQGHSETTPSIEKD